uniref:Vascular endothelial growth factor A n=1 Tax=Anas platyrhynchos platyrhynchos TaxID=8840 RepID=U3J9G9_ANAPP
MGSGMGNKRALCPARRGGLRVVTAFLLSLQLSKAAPALGDGERKPNEVIKFLEVYERSFCRTIETLVDIFQEYPDEVEYIFKPSCVPLMRCAGCCGDEGLECVPVDVYNVTMEIMRIKPHQSQHIAHMSFLQHSKCDCRPKKDVKNKQEKWAQKPRSDGPSFIPQTWSLHDPRPWQSFLMLYPESGKSRRVCPTRMDSRKSKRGKGKGQKRKRKKGRYKPPSFHWWAADPRRGSAGGGTAPAPRGVSGKAALACLALSNHPRRGSGARGGVGELSAPLLPLLGLRLLSPAVPPTCARATATGGGQAGACRAWVCVRACARVPACLVESQAERRGGTVGSWKRGAGEPGGSLSLFLFLSLSLSPCWFWWLLSLPVSK